MKDVLMQLMEEAYGALGWLNGTIQLGDRARVYKIKKLKMALDAAEACLHNKSLERTGEEGELR